jgi:hypothetical protein
MGAEEECRRKIVLALGGLRLEVESSLKKPDRAVPT